MATSPGPRYEYETRLRLCQAQLDALERTSRQVGNARLITALAGVGLLIAVLNLPVPAYLLVLPVLLFIVLAIYHEIVARRQELVRRRMRVYENGIHRLSATWAGTGTTGARFRDSNHVYADDLDLFGAGSLFELLCACRTEGGETKLAGWLMAPADREVVLSRQAAVTELTPQLDLREEWAVLGQGIQATADSQKLAAWSRTKVDPSSATTRVLLFIVSALGPVLFLASGAGWISFTASLVHFLVVAGLTAKYREKVERITAGLESSANDLGVLAGLIQYFEHQPAQAPLLRQLHATLGAGASLASTEIGKLRRLVDLLDSAHNMFFALVAFWLLWETQFAFAVAAWRARNGAHVTNWLDALAEMEALLSLSTYAYENPQAPFPDLDPAGQVFDANDLCHPLIPHAIGNDIHLTSANRLLIVSGSNMSGKSTLLRSVGLNTVLAWAGAPVRAQRLRISQLALGASFRTVDSVQEGRSRFYAEVLRLRQITELTQAGKPVMFLLDELLSGTNSHDRVQGSEMLLRGLLERGAIGLVTTHDLALTQLAEGLPGSVNVHFSDQFKDGEMHFDYHIKPGVVHHSNALELMRSVGLI